MVIKLDVHTVGQGKNHAGLDGTVLLVILNLPSGYEKLFFRHWCYLYRKNNERFFFCKFYNSRIFIITNIHKKMRLSEKKLDNKG